MNELFAGSIALSLLHAAIPNHWLPIVAIGRRAGWSAAKTLRITVLAGSAHALSTVLLGLLLGLAGFQFSAVAHEMIEKAGPVLLIVLGAVFVYRHYFHKHFHLHGEVQEQLPERQLIVALALAMFLSPCLEIGAFFLLAGANGAVAVLALSLLYTLTTVGGMAVWVQLVWRGLSLANWHTLEHNAGLLSGGVLMLTGLATLFWGH
jgi:nickel/cobalt transporter (NicO) family protein